MKKSIILSLFTLLFALPAQASIKIAVMPFEVLSKNPEMAQFGLGTTDTLTNALGSIPEFIMVDRGQLNAIIKEQAFQNSGFTNSEESVKLGKILNIELMVLGSIQNENDNYRITARFTDVATGKVLKSVQVTGNSIFTLQDQLAEELIKSQNIILTPEQNTRIDNITKATSNTSAYDLYTKGRNSYLKFTEAGFRESIDYFDKALQADKNYTLALASKSEAQALLSYELKKNGQDFDELLKESEKNALQAMNQQSELAEPHRALSIVYNLSKRRKQGGSEAQKAIMINPNDSEAHVSLWINSTFDPDDQLIHKAIKMNPYFAPAYNNLGLAYTYKKKYIEAIENFQQAIKVNPEYISSYLNLGLAYQTLKQDDAAIRSFQQGIKVNPGYAFAYYYLADAYSDQNKLQEAIEQLNNALKINPRFSQALVSLAGIYTKQGKLLDSANTLKKVVEINPNDKKSFKELAKTYQNLGISYYNDKNFDAAVNAYQDLLKLNPNDVSAIINLGVTYYSKGDITEAINNYQKAIAISPDNASAHDNLGIAYQAQKKNVDAIHEYKKACQYGSTASCEWLKANNL